MSIGCPACVRIVMPVGTTVAIMTTTRSTMIISLPIVCTTLVMYWDGIGWSVGVVDPTALPHHVNCRLYIRRRHCRHILHRLYTLYRRSLISWLLMPRNVDKYFVPVHVKHSVRTLPLVSHQGIMNAQQKFQTQKPRRATNLLSLVCDLHWPAFRTDWHVCC
jgi:hypothetical protein